MIFLLPISPIFPDFKFFFAGMKELSCHFETILWCIITPISSMKHTGQTFRIDIVKPQHLATVMICFRFWLYFLEFQFSLSV